MNNILEWVNRELERKIRRHCSNPDIICYPNKSKEFWEEVDARVNTIFQIRHLS